MKSPCCEKDNALVFSLVNATFTFWVPQQNICHHHPFFFQDASVEQTNQQHTLMLFTETSVRVTP